VRQGAAAVHRWCHANLDPEADPHLPSVLLLPWLQSKDLETFLKRFCSGFTWQDAPVESAWLFKRRLDAFMANYMPLNKKGVLGRVTHYVIRLEVQARGSRECAGWRVKPGVQVGSMGAGGECCRRWEAMTACCARGAENLRHRVLCPLQFMPTSCCGSMRTMWRRPRAASAGPCLACTFPMTSPEAAPLSLRLARRSRTSGC
jgi:hypothetical protein